jgi:hypothetical protein
VGSRRIEKAVLSAANNPYGATNALGVYYIDCLGQDFQMRDCRVVGTLVLLNTSGLMIDSSVSLEPGASGLPSLLVQGGAQIQTSAGDLSEPGLGANLNPAGTPYFGVSNNSQTDSYASVLAGVMYISGNVDLSVSVAIDGCMIVGGRATIAGTLRVKRFVDVTPPCFETPTGFTVVESSIAKQVR